MQGPTYFDAVSTKGTAWAETAFKGRESNANYRVGILFPLNCCLINYEAFEGDGAVSIGLTGRF